MGGTPLTACVTSFRAPDFVLPASPTLACAHAACVTNGLDPVLMLDKKMVLSAVFTSADATPAALDNEARLREGPLSTFTISALGTQLPSVPHASVPHTAAPHASVPPAAPALPADGVNERVFDDAERVRLLKELSDAAAEREQLNSRLAALTRQLNLTQA